MIGSRILLPGESVNITDIGEQPHNRSDNGSTLVCVTDNVNMACCRNRDTGFVGPIGNWIHNNQLVVSLNNAAGSTNLLVRVVYTRQVRLAAVGYPTGPVGDYTCSVPYADGTAATATVSIINVVAGEYITKILLWLLHIRKHKSWI